MITRTGRWIDFSNDYKTMDLKFMESVWWVFAQLYEKGLVYRGFKVSVFLLSWFLIIFTGDYLGLLCCLAVPWLYCDKIILSDGCLSMF